MGGFVRSSLGIRVRRRCVTSGLLRRNHLAPGVASLGIIKTRARTFTFC